MSTVELTLSQLIDRTVYDLAGPDDLGARTVLAAPASVGATIVQVEPQTEGLAALSVSDMVEFGSELMLVTSNPSTGTYVVSRGYYGTTAVSHLAGAVGLVNPPFARRRVAEAIRRSFARLEALGVPLVVSGTFNREPGLQYVELPAETREVYRVAYWSPKTGKLHDLAGWEFFESLPAGKFPTGKAINVGSYVTDSDDLEVTYRVPYRWSTHPNGPTGTATIRMPEGAEDLPCLYAAAWLTSSREISRAEIDRSEEWGRVANYQVGQVAALVRAKWQDFYRSLDEARRLNRVPQVLEYRTRPRA